MNKMRKTICFTLAFMLILSMVPGSAFAVHVSDGEIEGDTRCIYLFNEFYSDNNGTSPVKSVKTGENFFLFLNFSNNPLVLEQSVQAYDIFIPYNSENMTPVNVIAADSSGFEFNKEFDNSDLIKVSWASTTGLTRLNENYVSELVSSGTLFKVVFKATKDLTESDLNSISVLPSYESSKGEMLESLMADGSIKKIPVVFLPDLSVKMSQKAFDEKTPFELIKQKIESVTFTDKDRQEKILQENEYTAALKSGGDFTKDNNILVVTYNGYTVEIELTVNDKEYTKEDAKLTLSPGDPVTKVYGDADFDVTAVIGNPYANGKTKWAVTGDAVTIASGESGETATLHVEKVGEATVKASYESDYSMGDAELKVTVNKVGLTITAPSQEIFVDQAIPAMEPVFSIDAAKNEPEFKDLTVIPVGSDDTELKDTSTAGTYSVKFRNGNEIIDTLDCANYNVTLKTGKLTIMDRGDAGVSLGGPITKTYGDPDFEITAEVKAAGEGAGVYTWSVDDGGKDVISFTGNGSSINVKALKSGTATVKVSYKSETTKGASEVTVTVDKAKVIVDTTASPTSVKVGGANPTLSYSVTGLVGNDDIGSLKTGGGFDVKAYDKETGATEFVDTGKAGAYVVKFVDRPVFDENNEKYTVEVRETGCFTVEEKETAAVTLSGVPDTLKYGAADFTVTASVTGAAESGVYTWAVSGDEDVIRLDGTGSSVTAKVLKAGNAKISVTFESENYIGSADKDISVGKAGLTVKAGTYQAFVGSALPEMRAEYEGFVNGDNETTVDELKGLTVKAVKENGEAVADTSAPGDYSVKFFKDGKIVDAIETANYEVKLEPGTLKIRDKEDAKVTLDGIKALHTYGDGPLSLSAKAGVTGENGSFTWTSSNDGVISLSADKGESVTATILKSGKTTVTVSYESASSEGAYCIDVTVNKAKVTVDTAAVPTRVKVGGDAPALSCSVTGLVGNDDIGTYKTGGGFDVKAYSADDETVEFESTDDPGSYIVKFVEKPTFDESSEKYTFDVKETGAFSVVEKETAAVTLSGVPDTLKYGAEDFTVTAAVTGTAESGEYNWTVSGEEGVIRLDGAGSSVTAKVLKAGNAKISVTFESDNYIGSAAKDISVGKAGLTVKAGTYQVYKGSALPEMRAEYEGFVNGDNETTVDELMGLTVKEVKENGEAVADTETPGEYSVKFFKDGKIVDAIETANYEVKLETGTLTVKKAPTGNNHGTVGQTQYSIVASATAGGRISPTGTIPVEAGRSVTFTVTPDQGYEIADVVVDGKSVGKLSTYTFSNINENHTISAAFAEIVEAAAIPFGDVDENDWFYNDVVYVFTKGLMEGVSDTEFAPGMKNTRGMLVTILYRLEGEPDAAKADFTDVPSGRYYSEAVAWAAQNGIVNGYGDGRFGPDDSLTREQMVTILYRYSRFKGYDTGAAGLDGFTDAQAVSGFALEAMKWAVHQGIIEGVGDRRLDPAGTSNRDQLAAVLHRFCETIAK